MASILNKSFRYIPSFETDLRRTFARERRRLGIGPPPAEARPDATATVTPLPKRVKKSGR